VFVRTGGCDYRCRWCDTLYAVLPEHRAEWSALSAAEILARVAALAGGVPLLVSLSGGNPALQPLAPLLARGRAEGYRFALETQGSVARPWFAALDWLLLSPKAPSSGMAPEWAAVDACVAAAADRARVVLKVTVFDAADYVFARAATARYPALPCYLQVGNPRPASAGEPDLADLGRRYDWLVRRVADDRWFEVTILPQLHVLVWGNRRGV
jgi:7-carboxy-7-deazaguanine synthase